MIEKLENWVNNGWLDKHQPGCEEIADLLLVGSRDLKKSRTPNLGPDWKFNISYNAVLAFAQAALAACGYRAKGSGHHYWTLLSLEFTLGIDSETVSQLDNYRAKRNTNIYRHAGAVTEIEAEEIRQLSEKLLDTLNDWLKTEYPDLLKS